MDQAFASKDRTASLQHLVNGEKDKHMFVSGVLIVLAP